MTRSRTFPAAPAIALTLTVLAGTAALAAPPKGFVETAVEIKMPGGSLKGTLWRLKGGKVGPGVVIIAGSGATDRDGNQAQVKTNNLRMLAVALAGRGIASLRFDKRTLATSRLANMNERTIRFDQFVSDAGRWIRLLKRQKGISRVFVAGHSQGALVGTLAVIKEPVAGLIVMAGPGESIGTVLRGQLVRAKLPKVLLDEANAVISQMEKGREVPKVSRFLYSLFRPSVQPFLISWMKHDPARALARVKAPVLIVQGGQDLQVPTRQALILKKATPDARLVLIRDMNHVFKVPAGPSRADNIRTYTNPTLPLAPGLASAVIDFVLKTK
jgi:pimeloyl-ACP methyl ester carboxylesterase